MSYTLIVITNKDFYVISTKFTCLAKTKEIETTVGNTFFPTAVEAKASSLIGDKMMSYQASPPVSLVDLLGESLL